MLGYAYHTEQSLVETAMTGRRSKWGSRRSHPEGHRQSLAPATAMAVPSTVEESTQLSELTTRFTRWPLNSPCLNSTNKNEQKNWQKEKASTISFRRRNPRKKRKLPPRRKLPRRYFNLHLRRVIILHQQSCAKTRYSKLKTNKIMYLLFINKVTILIEVNQRAIR